MRVIIPLLICASIYAHNYARERPHWIREGGVWILEFPDGTWIWPEFGVRKRREIPSPTFQPDERTSISYESD